MFQDYGSGIHFCSRGRARWLAVSIDRRYTPSMPRVMPELQGGLMSVVSDVASNLLRETCRNRGFPLWVAALLVCTFVAPRLGGELDLIARLQLLVQYGLGLAVVMIGVVTLIVSIGSLGHEVDRRTIDLLVTRPIPRWQILLGKLLGVLALDTVLLALTVCVFLVNLGLLVSGAPDAQRELASRRFFSPRRSVEADSFDRPLLGEQEEMRLTFRGIATLGRPEETLLLRHRLDAIPRLETPILETLWTDTVGRGVRVSSRSSAGRVAVIELPIDLVEDDGSMSIDLRNAHPAGSGARIVVSPERIEVLYADGGFVGLLALALALVLLEFAFLAVVGICGAAVFRLPTAALFGAAIFLVGLVSPYLDESLAMLVKDSGAHAPADGPTTPYPAPLTTALVWMLDGVLQLLPDFTGDDPLRPVIESRSISWTDVTWRYGGSMLARGLVLLGIAAWFWRRRELGGEA